jgi:adenylate kinase family enzyme
MKVHIMGASCAGSTTLGNALSAKTGFPYFDTDQYFWEPSAIPFTIKRNPKKRINMLNEDIALHDHYIIGGSLVNWGNDWLTAFNLIVFLYVPPQIRMQRLKDREFERYGHVIYTDPARIKEYQRFLEWAEAYDTNAISGRTLQVHEDWLSRVDCPVLRITGDTSIQERIDLVISQINVLNSIQ